MQCLPRHQVDGAPEQVGKILRQVLDLPAERSPLSEFVEKIDIASWAILSTSDRTEDVESCDPKATTQRVQSRSALLPANDRHLPPHGSMPAVAAGQPFR